MRDFLLSEYLCIFVQNLTKMTPSIKISDFNYTLPVEKIAKYPLECRDDSRLLVFRDGSFCDDFFYNLWQHIPEKSFMVFNNTKVVPARLFFRKSTGALIEILCLNPENPSDYVTSFASRGTCTWNVVVGNARKWKDGFVHFFDDSLREKLDFRAELLKKAEEGRAAVVRFCWSSDMTFSEVLELCGQIPIPPYLNRESEAVDKLRYQTIYAHYEGSVAAPTAGLHFTDRVLASLDAKQIVRENVCLHVGAGTFVPVKTEFIADHPMHSEPFSVSRMFLEHLLEAIDKNKVISVGTTSARCLESLYYIGVRCMENPTAPILSVNQWEPYEKEYKYSVSEVLEAIVAYMDKAKTDLLLASTEIIIVPGFKFRVVDMLITNFHQPQSTLLLLISAFIGDSWRKLYSHALDSGYRFLSYGDSSLLYRQI